MTRQATPRALIGTLLVDATGTAALMIIAVASAQARYAWLAATALVGFLLASAAVAITVRALRSERVSIDVLRSAIAMIVLGLAINTLGSALVAASGGVPVVTAALVLLGAGDLLSAVYLALVLRAIVAAR